MSLPNDLIWLVNARRREMHAAVSYSGGTNGLCRQADGTWVAGVPNQPRWGYAENGEMIVHIEAKDATNTMSRSAPYGWDGASGGIALTKEGTLMGLPASIWPQDGWVFQNTPKGAFAPGDVVTGSVILCSAPGTTYNTSLAIDYPPGTRVYGIPITVTDTPTRYSVTATIPANAAAGVEARLYVSDALGGANPKAGSRCAGWQLELGPVATTPITTDGAPVTRKADLFDVDNTVLGLPGNTWTLIARYLAGKGAILRQDGRDAYLTNIDNTPTIYRGGDSLQGSLGPMVGIGTVVSSQNGATQVTLNVQGQAEQVKTTASADTNVMTTGHIGKASNGDLYLGEIAFLAVLKRQATAEERASLVQLQNAPGLWVGEDYRPTSRTGYHILWQHLTKQNVDVRGIEMTSGGVTEW